MELVWHKYRYFPYEQELARKELNALLDFESCSETNTGLRLSKVVDSTKAARLTYFDSYVNGHGPENTIQSQIETTARKGSKRQATRYSVHGLHEYKGKFNPQVARALLNIFGVSGESRVLDPFCGSGTTLVEAAQLGASARGTDLNPLAVYIANAKLQLLKANVEEVEASFQNLKNADAAASSEHEDDNDRSQYLGKWFQKDILYQIEKTKQLIEEKTRHLAPVFLVIASNLLREYSLQDPRDLRIRRRRSALPTKPFDQAFLEACELLIGRVTAAHRVTGVNCSDSKAELKDNTTLSADKMDSLFDCAVTSPPYATALPYIDTQRLSLVWLGMITPREVNKLEAELIGSREFRGKEKKAHEAMLLGNSENLPVEQAEFCLELMNSLGDADGFRRQAVPALLYRYFVSMQASMEKTKQVLKPDANYALIVGHNHTTLGGQRFDIDTPTHLAMIAENSGWKIEELMPLQTYHRFDGYHVGNAVAAETLIILKNS